MLGSLLGWAGLLAVALYLATLSQEAPFSGGQLLGRGFLLGSVLTLLSLLFLRRVRGAGAHEENSASTPSAEFPLAVVACGLVSTNTVFLAWKATPVEPLVGLALAAALFGIVVRFGLAPFQAADGDQEQHAAGGAQDDGRAAEQFTLVTITIAVAVVLAAKHFPGKPDLHLWSLPLALTSVTLLAAVVGDSLGSLLGATRRYLPVALVTGPLVALAGTLIVAGGVYHELASWYAYAAGVGFLGVAGWLLLTQASSGSTGGSPAQSLQSAAIASLLVIAGFIVAFRLQAGMGAALALLGGWLFVILASARPRTGPITQSPAQSHFAALMTLGLMFVLYRLYLEQVPECRELTVTLHYTYASLALGVLTPFLWMAHNLRTGDRVARRLRAHASAARTHDLVVGAMKSIIGRIAWLGVMTVGPPLAIIVLWRERAGAAFIVGLLLSQIFLLIRRVESANRQPSGQTPSVAEVAPGLLSVGCALATAQLSQLVIPLAESPRLHRMIGAGVIALLLVIWATLTGGASAPGHTDEEASGS